MEALRSVMRLLRLIYKSWWAVFMLCCLVMGCVHAVLPAFVRIVPCPCLVLLLCIPSVLLWLPVCHCLLPVSSPLCFLVPAMCSSVYPCLVLLFCVPVSPPLTCSQLLVLLIPLFSSLCLVILFTLLYLNPCLPLCLYRSLSHLMCCMVCAHVLCFWVCAWLLS